jgi:hypothetical protein
MLMCSQVAMPLFFQGHSGQLEEFLSRSREQQIEFVQLLDHMISRDSNMDVLIGYDNFEIISCSAKS